jgi:hypothetical protein
MSYSFATPFGEKIKNDLGDGTYILVDSNDPQYLNWLADGNTAEPYPYEIAPEVIAWKEQQETPAE